MLNVKEAGVHPRALEAQPLWRPAWRQVRFSLADARRALPYVARVIQDATEAFADIQFARTELSATVRTARRVELDAQRDSALRRLDYAIDECNAVGADLLDICQGLVRFNAEVDGRLVSLLWRLGEPVINAWHCLD